MSSLIKDIHIPLTQVLVEIHFIISIFVCVSSFIFIEFVISGNILSKQTCVCKSIRLYNCLFGYQCVCYGCLFVFFLEMYHIMSIYFDDSIAVYIISIIL